MQQVHYDHQHRYVLSAIYLLPARLSQSLKNHHICCSTRRTPILRSTKLPSLTYPSRGMDEEFHLACYPLSIRTHANVETGKSVSNYRCA